MKNMILEIESLNAWMKDHSIFGTLKYRNEISHTVRAGRDQISLNNSVESHILTAELQLEKKMATLTMSCANFDQKIIRDQILNIWSNISLMPDVKHLSKITPLENQGCNKDEECEQLTNINSKHMVDLFKKVANHFSKDSFEISGAFSSGSYGYITINTSSKNCISYIGSDYNVEVVVQLLDLDKSEIRSASVGESFDQYNPQIIIDELLFHYDIKQKYKKIDISLGKYNIIFSSSAFAEMVGAMSSITFGGENYEYEYSMIPKTQDIEKTPIFGKNITITDDPLSKHTLFARIIGKNGISKPAFTLVENGYLKNRFYTHKETCDRFLKKQNNDSSVAHLLVSPGNAASDLNELIELEKGPTLYINYIHYLNFTQLNKGEFTGTSRFGTYLIENGKIINQIHNLRINDNFFNIFNNIEWLSKDLEPIDASHSYEMRLASSISVPKFVKVKGVNITGTSSPKEN